MSKMKKIRVRKATVGNIGLFKKLWMGVLEKQAKEGSLVVPSEKSLSAYEKLFITYTEGSLEGVVLFVGVSGVLMWGDVGTQLDYVSKTAMAWGSYAETDLSEEIYKALFDEAITWSKDHDFKCVLIESYKGSKIPEGFEPVIAVSSRSLDGN